MSECIGKYINCIFFQLFFVVQALQKNVGFFFRSCESKHIGDCDDEIRHYKGAPEGCNEAHKAPKRGFQSKFSKTDCRQSYNNIPHCIIELVIILTTSCGDGPLKDFELVSE